MKFRLPMLVASLAVTAPLMLPARAQPIPSVGFTSANVQVVGHVPFEVGTATGATVHGNYLFVTSWKNFTIYDIKDPVNPRLVATEPFGFKFENEDVATNGRILLFSESLPGNALHIFDLEDINDPDQVSSVSGAGDHTTSCIRGCKYAWGSSGTVTDLRDPRNPEIIGDWSETVGGRGHDVTEIANGLIFTASRPVRLLDARRDPASPRLLATGDNDAFAHSVRWPRGGRDKFALVGGETNANTRCDDGSAVFTVMDTTGWQKTKRLRTVSEYSFKNGLYADGNPTVNGLGCSPHWFTEHRTFRNGGLVALGAYEHGTRFLVIKGDGKIQEVGWYVPVGGSTSAAYWMTDELVYNIDYSRGIDILRYTGPLK